MARRGQQCRRQQRSCAAEDVQGRKPKHFKESCKEPTTLKWEVAFRQEGTGEQCSREGAGPKPGTKSRAKNDLVNGGVQRDPKHAMAS